MKQTKCKDCGILACKKHSRIYSDIDNELELPRNRVI